MKLEFDSIDEVKAFYAQLKGTRGKKGDDEPSGDALTGALAPPVQVPQPMAIPTQQPVFNPAGFAPQAQPAGPAAQGFPAAVADPKVTELVTKITQRLDSTLASGQAPDAALTWFRSQCAQAGLDAAQATLDQIKTIMLPKMSVPLLENIAKLMGCT
jgi:hypothetical protein